MSINLAPLVQVWVSAIKAAEKSKSRFTKTGKACEQFYIGAADSFWDDYRREYMGSLPAPGFKIVLNLTFELASIMGPSLMWKAPGRQVTGFPKLDIPPEVYALTRGLSPDDPMFAQVAQQIAMESRMEDSMADAANALMEQFLNYTTRETPGGGLAFESKLSILDALIKGRGVMRVDTYNPVGTDDVLTGAFHVSVDDLLIDPDSRRANLTDAKWIAIRHIEPHWEIERKFGWPEGSLRGKSTMETKQSAAANRYTMDGVFQRRSDTSDLGVWWEIFSKMGAGTRFKQRVLPEWHDAFEASTGDFAHICIMNNVPEPLNLRSSFVGSATPEDVGRALSWPIPFHDDGRWPVSLLDFHHIPNDAWPMAIISSGMGELVFLNVIMSSIAERVYRSGLTKIALRQELAEDCTAKLLSLRHEVVELNPAIGGRIDEFVSFLEHPPVNFDVWRMVDQASLLFAKRTGLSELLYGIQQKVSRTAADANQRGAAVAVRPEHMFEQVSTWQAEIAELEKLAAADGVRGDTLTPLLGTSGAALWTQLITNGDQKKLMRSMRARIEASSMRRPDKTKDVENVQQLGAFYLPLAQWYASTTGNTAPLNAFLEVAGKSMEQDLSEMSFEPVNQQGPSEEEIAAMQEMQELEKADKQTRVAGREMANAKLAHELLERGQGVPQEFLSSVVPSETFQAPIPSGAM